MRKRATFDELLFWPHFDQKRTREAGGAIDYRLHGVVSSTVPPGTTYREHVEQMIREATHPLPVVFISPLLDEKRSMRSRTYFGYTGQQIDSVLENYPGMRWWMANGGLMIDLVSDDAHRLSEFDRRAGKLACDSTHAGKLSHDALKQIAAELDAAGFALSEHLQPAQWSPIAKFNQAYSKKAIGSFSAAAAHPMFSRAVRRRLYVARDRYRAAYKISTS